MENQKARAKARPTTREKRDDSIMNTNSSCIVSKRSVEKLYNNDDHGFLRYFVKKFQRRSPLINRGYWLRMRAIEHLVRQFLSEPAGAKKFVVNLGCGYDTMPFKFLAQQRELCQSATFVDMDYRQLILKKCEVIRATKQLHEVIADFEMPTNPKDVILKSEKYYALACDLQKIQDLDHALRKLVDPRDDVSILYIAEVSMTYMDATAANTLIKWASGFAPGQFCLLEQYLPDGPDHPFASTMLKHFVKLQSRLKSAEDYPTLQHQHDRFSSGGWPEVRVRNLWNLWSDDAFLTAGERKKLDEVEPFDEWEEFALFGCHYFLLLAKTAGISRVPPETVPCDGDSSQAEDASGEKDLGKAFVEFFEYPKGQGLRRFGAALKASKDNIAIHGGHGERGRLQSADSFGKHTNLTNGETNQEPVSFPRAEVMCHTITSLGEGTDLLVGGRGSPDRPSSDCYLRTNNTWRRVGSLPYGLYRHCAVAVPEPNSDDDRAIGVLVLGGKTSASMTSKDVLFWDHENQWRKLTVIGQQPCARSGAAMLESGAGYGHLTGGIGEDGKVLSDLWTWKISREASGDALTIEFTDSSKKLLHDNGTEGVWGRYGASLVRSPWGILLVGGIGRDMIEQKNEILVLGGDWSIRRLGMEVSGPRPLFIGTQAVEIDDDNVLLLGGGAVCFSFGTFWNEGCYTISTAAQKEDTWQLLAPKTKPTAQVEETAEKPRDATPAQTRRPREAKKVARRVLASAEDFQEVQSKGRPIVLEGLDIGKCTEAWNMDYLKEKVGADRKVVVHSSPSPSMNFLAKNFTYTTVPFEQFINDVKAGGQMYLRALSSERPAEQATTLEQDFPGLSDDFKLPAELAFVKANAHSSPLRISGPVAMWLHYDVMANVLCQIRGHKKLILYSPREVAKLGFPAGASSSSINVFDDETIQRAGLGSVQAHEASLKPGDVLFIPALWAHAARPTDSVSVAVNVFFRNLEAGYAAGKDVYGNRDLQAYEQGRRDIAKMGKAFQQLPGEVGRFYLSRLATELQAVASEWGGGQGAGEA